MEQAKKLLELFRGRSDYIAHNQSGHFEPYPLEGKTLTPEKFAQYHFNGVCLGFYLITAENTVFCSCLDFDNHDDTNPHAIRDAQSAYLKLKEAGLKPLFEISSSGQGAHIWLITSEPLDSNQVYRFWRRFKALHDWGHIEQYPRQPNLNDLKLGSLVRYPLFGESHFLDDEFQLADVNYAATKLMTAAEFSSCVNTPENDHETEIAVLTETVSDILPIRVDRLLRSNPNSILGIRWNNGVEHMSDPSNSAIVLSIATELVRAYIPTDDIRTTLLVWASLNAYEKGLREDFLERTIDKAYSYVCDKRQMKSFTGTTLCDINHNFIDKIYEGGDIIIPTGIDTIDLSVGGGGLGEYVVVSARPSMGKTAFTLNWLHNCISSQRPCLLISLEMSGVETARRTIMGISNLPKEEWNTESGYKLLHKNVDEFYGTKAPLYFVEGVETIERLEQVVEKHVSEYGVQVVAVDYQGLLSTGNGYLDSNEYKAQTEITKRLKKTAQRHNILLISLVQMNRQTESTQRKNTAPQMSDLKGTGQIEADADMILFCYWPWKDDPTLNKHEYRISAAKCRNREIVVPHMAINFDAQRQIFY